MATNGSSGKSKEIRSKRKWETTTHLKSNFCSNQHENRFEDGTRKHITCYCCGYPGHFTQECPRWNGSFTAPLGSSDGRLVERMRKGLHPQMQWISYVTQSGRLINIMMTKVNHTGKVYHMRAKRQMAQSLGQIAKFKRRYEQEAEENKDNK